MRPTHCRSVLLCALALAACDKTKDGGDGDNRHVCGDGFCDTDETDTSCGVDCGCAASSCEEAVAPFGCRCDADCFENGDCCDDAETCVGKPTYVNPAVGFNCPDPGVLNDDGRFYMVCTGGRFPIRVSDNLILWEDTGAAILPGGSAAWSANGGRNWAPEIHRVGDRYVAYFTAVNGADVLSIGAAWADSPLGPYTDRGGPLVEDPQGVIDATYFRDPDDGAHYLLYKIDGNAHGQPTPILIRKLAADGLSFAGAPVEILRNDSGSWEGGVVEAPWLVKRNGTYYLFYSGNVYDGRYRTGVARSDSLVGPYQKHGAPILANDDTWMGPGHGSVVSVNGGDLFVYHAWRVSDGKGRFVLVDLIDWVDGWPAINDGTPSDDYMPWPLE
ncbi:MAG TPA: family 43 glycosylhydrolase [Kofleriaceae bacterium]